MHPQGMPFRNILRRVYLEEAHEACPYSGAAKEECGKKFCEYNMICNYLAEHHREAYSWHAQIHKKGWRQWKVKPEATYANIPIPSFFDTRPIGRVAVHGGYMGSWVRYTKCHDLHGSMCEWSPLIVTKIIDGVCRSVQVHNKGFLMDRIGSNTIA